MASSHKSVMLISIHLVSLSAATSVMRHMTYTDLHLSDAPYDLYWKTIAMTE